MNEDHYIAIGVGIMTIALIVFATDHQWIGFGLVMVGSLIAGFGLGYAGRQLMDKLKPTPDGFRRR